jgi:hypothetical protein
MPGILIPITSSNSYTVVHTGSSVRFLDGAKWVLSRGLTWQMNAVNFLKMVTEKYFTLATLCSVILDNVLSHSLQLNKVCTRKEDMLAVKKLTFLVT